MSEKQISPRPIKAVILAAGEGTRLRSSQDAPPKPLTCVGGMSLLERAVLVCRDAGVSDIIVVIGFGQAELLPVLAELRAAADVTPCTDRCRGRNPRAVFDDGPRMYSRRRTVLGAQQSRYPRVVGVGILTQDAG